MNVSNVKFLTRIIERRTFRNSNKYDILKFLCSFKSKMYFCGSYFGIFNISKTKSKTNNSVKDHGCANVHKFTCLVHVFALFLVVFVFVLTKFVQIKRFGVFIACREHIFINLRHHCLNEKKRHTIR